MSCSADPHHFFLPTAHGRELLDASRAAELLPSADERHYTRLSLSGHSFSLPAARVFAPCIASLDSLTDVDLSDIIAQRSAEEAVAVLDSLCSAVSGHQLLALNLSDNAIGARGVESVSRALRTQRRLHRVLLNNDGLQGQAVKQLVDAMLQPFKKEGGGQQGQAAHHPTALRHLELYRNLLQDDGPRALVPLVLASPSLSHFSISSSRVGSSGGLALATALSSLSGLEHLNLSDSSLGPAAGLVLARQLLVPSRTQSLSFLQLGDIGVNDSKGSGEAIRAIIVALRTSCPKLQQLDLQSNELTPRHARLLAASLADKRALSHLNLEGNDIRALGALALADALSPATHPQLIHVNLAYNAITSKAAPALVQLLRGGHLSALLLNGNRIRASALHELRSAVEEHGTEPKDALGSLSDNEEEDEDEEDAEEHEAEAEVAIAEAEEAEETGGDEEKDGEVDRLADELAAARVQ